MIISQDIIDASSTSNKINAKVELYDGSTLVTTCTCNDRLQDFVIERVGQNNKFFGFGVFQKVTINLIDLYDDLTISETNTFKVYLGIDDTFVDAYPTFYVSEINRNDDTNIITVVAYDILHTSNIHTISEISYPYTLNELAIAIGNVLGASQVDFENISERLSSLYYEQGGNYEGTENLKDVLDDLAEVLSCIYFMGSSDRLIFKSLYPVDSLIVTEDDYYSLNTEQMVAVNHVAHVDELGNNILGSNDYAPLNGVTQYIRNNPFLENRSDIADILSEIVFENADIALTSCICEWDGNILLEIGDKLLVKFTVENPDASSPNTAILSVLNDIIQYNGFLTETTQWKYENKNETPTNPSNLGEAIKQTYAQVDKVNKEITLLTSSVANNDADIASLQITTDSIISSVSSLKTTTTTIEDNLGALTENVETISQTVSTKLTASDFDIKVTEKLSSGVDEIAINETGFKFDKTGLTITKSDSEMSTNVDEDGLSVYKNNEEVLTANNAGVRAKNLHATTYLIVGTNTYFSDYTATDGESRAGCFWTGE